MIGNSPGTLMPHITGSLIPILTGTLISDTPGTLITDRTRGITCLLTGGVINQQILGNCSPLNISTIR